MSLSLRTVVLCQSSTRIVGPCIQNDHIVSGTVSGKILALHSASVILFSHVLLPGVLQSTALICVSAKCSFRVFAAGSSSGLSLFLSPLHDCVVSHLDAV